jgi:hypothetical protein
LKRPEEKLLIVKRSTYLAFLVLIIFAISSCAGDTMEKPRFLKSRGEVFIDKQLNAAAKAVEKGLDVNSVGEHGFNLLYWALKFDSLKVLRDFCC